LFMPSAVSIKEAAATASKEDWLTVAYIMEGNVTVENFLEARYILR